MKVMVPDLGSAQEVDVIEVMVSPGDAVTKDAPLIMLEGDKATMEIPSPYQGVVKSIAVKAGDKVATGKLILELESEDEMNVVASKPSSKKTESKSSVSEKQKIDLVVPDLGGANSVDVIEILVQPGDTINQNDSIVVLEGDKATMEVPATQAGIVDAIAVSVGSKVSPGDPLLKLLVSADDATAKSIAPASPVTTTPSMPAAENITTPKSAAHAVSEVYAGPGVRRLARVLGLELKQIAGSGHKGRVTREDLEAHIKARMNSTVGAQRAPDIDFSQFGPFETVTLSKIKRLTGEATHRSWSSIPHVTQFDEADITDLERFRKTNASMAEEAGAKLTLIVFVMKALVACLKQFPTFNASLKPNGTELVLKQYFHIGVAVDTPNGLVVPVVRDVDKKGLIELAIELAAISKKAREKGLNLQEMQGSSITISSLGGIGGTAFTPIVNAPDVAILGLSKAKMQPVYDGNDFRPRLILPVSFSYDHRVIDGAEAARFTKYLSDILSDIRRLLM